jgi:hypothetical protein
MEGKGRNLTEVFSSHLPQSTEESYEDLYSIQSISGARFEPVTSRTVTV